MQVARERGWQPMSRADFEASRTLRGANFIGSPQEIVEKILFQHEIFGHDRFLVQFSVGTLPHDKIMRSIELFGPEVAPVVREELATRETYSSSRYIGTRRFSCSASMRAITST